MQEVTLRETQELEHLFNAADDNLTPLTKAEMAALSTLFTKIRAAIGDLGETQGNSATMSPADFMEVVNSYRQKSRYFHSVEHLLDMTEIDESEYLPLVKAFNNNISGTELLELQQINKLAAFFHDEEYTHVDGGLSAAGKKLVEQKYITEGENGALVVAANLPNDTNGQLIGKVLEVFGITPGSTLSPYAGMNELLSAMNAAITLNTLGVSQQKIMGVVASIEATVPFKGENRLTELRERMDKVMPSITRKEDQNLVDCYVANAALLSNKDVSGLTGGLTNGESPTANHVRPVMIGTDRLHLEEVGELRVSKAGSYPPRALLSAVNKQHTLFNGMLTPDTHHRIFHGFTIRSSGKEYPPAAELAAANDKASKIAPLMGTVLRARVAAMALVTSLAHRHHMQDAHIADLLSNNNAPANLPPIADNHCQIAQEILKNRQVGTNDTPHSAIAEQLLVALGDDNLKALVGDNPLKNSAVLPILQHKEQAAENFIAAMQKMEAAQEIITQVECSIQKHATAQTTGRGNWKDYVKNAVATQTYTVSGS